MPDRHAGAALAPVDREVCGRCGAAAWRVSWRGGKALQHVDATVDGDHWPVLGHWTPPVSLAVVEVESDDVEPVAVELPEPEVRARRATPDEVPKGAHDIERWASSRGWSTSLHYARGPKTDSQGRPVMQTERVPKWNENGEPVLTPTGKHSHENVKTDRVELVESVVLRAWQPSTGAAVVAVWVDGGAHGAWRLTPMLERVTIPGLRGLLDSERPTL